jgi:putative transposase
VSWKDRNAIPPAIKAIDRAENADIALIRLEAFEASAIRPSARLGGGRGSMSSRFSRSPRRYVSRALALVVGLSIALIDGNGCL